MAFGTNIGRGIRMMFIGILTSKRSYPIQNRHFKIVVIIYYVFSSYSFNMSFHIRFYNLSRNVNN